MLVGDIKVAKDIRLDRLIRSIKPELPFQGFPHHVIIVELEKTFRSLVQISDSGTLLDVGITVHGKVSHIAVAVLEKALRI